MSKYTPKEVQALEFVEQSIPCTLTDQKKTEVLKDYHISMERMGFFSTLCLSDTGFIPNHQKITCQEIQGKSPHRLKKLRQKYRSLKFSTDKDGASGLRDSPRFKYYEDVLRYVDELIDRPIRRNNE